MSEDLTLPILAAGVLLWYLVVALRQWRAERLTIEPQPMLVWREARTDGWSDWNELTDVDPSTDYDGVLSAVRAAATPGATAVQFATIVHPAGAPAYTLRVLFLSAVREPRDTVLAMTR